ncbi:MAG TPA: LysR family transcriptional regulator [Verrucomicrobiales bacterium]|nr:LysR family transcriptional regulator [Verrucomicrobiales bacterium]
MARHPKPRGFNLADVDVRLLRVLQAVVRNRGFAAAQSDLGLSAATISNHIARLEVRLGVRLCERGRRGFSLTEDGMRIHEASLTLFRSIDNFSGIVGSVRGELTGQVHFGTVDAMYTNSGLALHEALGRFHDLAPKVMLNIETASPQLLQQRLLDGRYFLILTPIDAPHAHINAVPVFEETQELYCGRTHPLFDQPAAKIRPATLAGYAYAARSYMTNWTGLKGISFRSAALTAHMESLAMLVLSGKYLGHLPVHYADSWVRQGHMRSLLPHEMSYVDTFYLAHLASEKNRAMSTLYDCLRSHIGEGRMPRY